MKTAVDKEHWFTFQYALVNEVIMDFRVYEIVGLSAIEAHSYRRKGGDSMDFTEDLDAAEVFMSGHVKWDGCANFMFDEQDNCMLHFCSNPGAKFKAIFDRLYAVAAELMPDSKQYLINAPEGSST